MKSSELREQYGKLVADARAVLDNPDSNYSEAEREAKFDQILGEADKVEENIKKVEKIEAAERSAADYERHLNASAGRKVKPEQAIANVEIANNERLLAVQGMMRMWSPEQKMPVTAEQLNAIERCGWNPNSNSFKLSLRNEAPKSIKRMKELEERSITTATGAMVPTTIETKIENALLQYGKLRDYAYVYRTATGNPEKIPTCNDTSNKGQLLGEGAGIALTDPTYSYEDMLTFKFSSRAIQVSVEALRDNVVSLENEIVKALGIRIARIENQHFTTGVGSTSAPEGVVTGSTSGVTLASASAITFDEIKDLFYSVDADYRDNDTCAFMMNDSTWKIVAKVKNSAGQYMVQTDITQKEVKSILGSPVFTNPEVAAFGATNKVMVFGDFSKFYIRDVNEIIFRRLDELYAANHLVGFLAFHGAGSVVVDAGTHPLKYAVCP